MNPPNMIVETGKKENPVDDKHVVDSSVEKGVLRGRSISYSPGFKKIGSLPLPKNPSSSIEFSPRSKTSGSEIHSDSSSQDSKLASPENSPRVSPSRSLDQKTLEMGVKFIEGMRSPSSSPVKVRKSEKGSDSEKESVKTSEKESGKTKVRSATLSERLFKRTASKTEEAKAQEPIIIKKKESTENIGTQASAAVSTAEIIPQLTKTDHILREILKTEKTQNNNLAVLVAVREVFKEKIAEKKSDPNKEFFKFLKGKHLADKEQAIEDIRKQGEEIVLDLLDEAKRIKVFSDGLLFSLDKAFSDANPLFSVAKIFAGMTSGCSAYHKAGKLYDKYLHFQALLTDRGKAKLIEHLTNLLSVEAKASKLNFVDYAITLVQRLPRYVLFFEQLMGEVKAKKDEMAEVYPLIEKSLGNLKGGTHQMNANTKRATLALNATFVKQQFNTPEAFLTYLGTQGWDPDALDQLLKTQNTDEVPLPEGDDKDPPSPADEEGTQQASVQAL